MNITYTGSSGFIGQNLMSYLQTKHQPIKCLTRNDFENITIKSIDKSDVVIHLAGKAHDLKNISLPSVYYHVNTDLTKRVFDEFLLSEAKIFITLSSVKAIADEYEGKLTENVIPNPISHYGKSKLLAEQYILSHQIPHDKRVYILRPCMIHGQDNKGNLNLLYKMVSKGFPWPLGAFVNQRSFCSIDNLCYIINELIDNEKVPSGVYNIADDDSISTNEIINLIAESQGKKAIIWNIPKLLIKTIAKLGDLMCLPLNTEKLNKLTQTYIVSNKKIKEAINKPLPINSKEGLIKTFNSFNNAK